MNNEPKKSQSEITRERWQDPVKRANMIKGMHRPRKPLSDEHKAVLRERGQELWQDPEYRTKVEQRLHDPDVQAKLRVPNAKKSAAMKAMWDKLDPSERAKRTRPWVEAGSKSAKEKLKGRIFSSSTLARMSEGGLAKWTPPLRKKCADIRRQWWQSQPPETKLMLNIPREALGRRTGSSKLEIRLAKELERLGISFEKEKPVGTYRLDFYLPDYHLDLECDGEYWHNQPRHIANDQRRDKYLTDLGYRVYRLRGKQITTDVAGAVQLALASVSP